MGRRAYTQNASVAARGTLEKSGEATRVAGESAQPNNYAFGIPAAVNSYSPAP